MRERSIADLIKYRNCKTKSSAYVQICTHIILMIKIFVDLNFFKDILDNLYFMGDHANNQNTCLGYSTVP